MTTIIDFTTRERSTDRPPSIVEIIDWRDPIMRDTPPDATRVVIDGLVTLELAREIVALCSRHNGGWK